MKNQKQISKKNGVVVIIAAAVIFIGGSLAYNYFAKQQTNNQAPPQKIQTNPTPAPTPSPKPAVPPVITYGTDQSSQHNSVHIYPEVTTITGKDEQNDIPFTKVVTLPKFKDINDKNILDNINQILSFENITGCSNIDDYKCSFETNYGGNMGVDYQVNYDKSNVLSVSFVTEFLGPYPSENLTNYSINLASGEAIKFSDIFYQNKINDLLAVLNTKLQENISQKEVLDEKEGLTVVGDQMQEGKRYDPNYGMFTEENMITGHSINGDYQAASYKIDSTGIKFIYNFDFPHVVQGDAPNGEIDFSYIQLKDYIDPNGLLGGEIK